MWSSVLNWLETPRGEFILLVITLITLALSWVNEDFVLLWLPSVMLWWYVQGRVHKRDQILDREHAEISAIILQDSVRRRGLRMEKDL